MENTDKIWSGIHKKYKEKTWIDKPSIFAETAIIHFPRRSRILELGAGQAQDSRFFADNNHHVISTDKEAQAQVFAAEKLSSSQKELIDFELVDIQSELPYEDESFDVVYSHLALHYFSLEETREILAEIRRVLKPGGKFAFLVNSTSDPEFNTGEEIEPFYFLIDGQNKRYFNVDSAKSVTGDFETLLLDDRGETYKDAEKGVHNLIRFIGSKV